MTSTLYKRWYDSLPASEKNYSKLNSYKDSYHCIWDRPRPSSYRLHSVCFLTKKAAVAICDLIGPVMLFTEHSLNASIIIHRDIMTRMTHWKFMGCDNCPSIFRFVASLWLILTFIAEGFVGSKKLMLNLQSHIKISADTSVRLYPHMLLCSNTISLYSGANNKQPVPFGLRLLYEQ